MRMRICIMFVTCSSSNRWLGWRRCWTWRASRMLGRCGRCRGFLWYLVHDMSRWSRCDMVPSTPWILSPLRKTSPPTIERMRASGCKLIMWHKFCCLFQPLKVLYPAYPFLVLSALCEGGMGRDVARVCAGVTPPEVYPHLEVAALYALEADSRSRDYETCIWFWLPGNSTPSSPAWAWGRSPGRTQCCTFRCKYYLSLNGM